MESLDTAADLVWEAIVTIMVEQITFKVLLSEGWKISEPCQ